MGRQSKTFNKETHVERSGKMKLMCLAILLLGLSCLVESQRPTGRPGRPNPQEMCANTMEFFMDLGWAGPTDDAPCPDPKALWKFMLERWDADGNGCLSTEEFAQMWLTWGWVDQWMTFSRDLTRMEMVALSLESGGGL